MMFFSISKTDVVCRRLFSYKYDWVKGFSCLPVTGSASSFRPAFFSAVPGIVTDRMFGHFEATSPFYGESEKIMIEQCGNLIMWQCDNLRAM